MPSGLIAALAAPIREVAASVGPGWSEPGDPIPSLAEVRDLLADVAAATRGGWSRTAEDWSGAGADGAAEFMSATAELLRINSAARSANLLFLAITQLLVCE